MLNDRGNSTHNETPLSNGLRVHLGSQRDRLRKLHANYLVSRRPRRGQASRLAGGTHCVLNILSNPIRTLHKTVRSLLAQDIRADRMILWLKETSSTFPMMFGIQQLVSKFVTAPTSARTRKSFLLSKHSRKRYRHGRRRPLLSSPLVDDLVSGVVPDEKVIACVRAHKPEMHRGTFSPYSSWTWEFVTSGEVRDDLSLPGSSALYPPGSLAPETATLRHSPSYARPLMTYGSTAWLSAPAPVTARSVAVSSL